MSKLWLVKPGKHLELKPLLNGPKLTFVFDMLNDIQISPNSRDKILLIPTTRETLSTVLRNLLPMKSHKYHSTYEAIVISC
jgi:muramoyltetrapeptide carboxypeptidase LdcA involved in peptidoglycan recycling